MIQIKIPYEDIQQLGKLKNHVHPLVQDKAMALLLKNQKVPHKKIALSLGICSNTLRNYLYGYQEQGMKFVTAINAYRPQSALMSFDQVVMEYLEKTPPASINQACIEVYNLTGVQLKETQMRHHLKRLGGGYRKVCGIPAKADVEKQRLFKEEKLNPILEEAKIGSRTVFFIDAAHFVLGAFLGYLWSLTRIFVRTPSGRQRFNVLGALNAVTKELLTITNDTYITSIQVCELLKLIAQQTTGPITLVLDNARYQRCTLVMQLAEQLKIELLFLPPYSPNLNLIERLWKFTKKNCLNSRYYGDFGLFKQAILTLLTTMNETHSQELNSLLTLNFQVLEEKKIKKAI